MRFLLILLLTTTIAAAPEVRLTPAGAAEFDRYWSPVLMTLFGCKTHYTEGILVSPVQTDDCNVKAGRIDYLNYKKAREEAKKLFDLHE